MKFSLIYEIIKIYKLGLLIENKRIFLFNFKNFVLTIIIQAFKIIKNY